MNTHCLDAFGVGDVVNDDFGHFGEMPTVPFLPKGKMSAKLGTMKTYLDSHGINVDFLV
jgi:hypothetical protein